MNKQTIEPKELHNKLKEDSGLSFIDVRTPGEYQSEHIPQTKNYPLDSSELKAFINENKNSSKTIYITCQKGARGKSACSQLTSSGIQAVNLEGGLQGWKDAGLPTVEGSTKVISMERQVRIAAGLFVVLGVILSEIAFPSAIYLSAFVGLGLVFSGITDTCGMARVLSLLPWNNSKCCCKNSCSN